MILKIFYFGDFEELRVLDCVMSKSLEMFDLLTLLEHCCFEFSWSPLKLNISRNIEMAHLEMPR